MEDRERDKNIIVVTGATGYIGNILVRQLLSMGEKVRVFVPPFEDLKSLNGLDVEIFQRRCIKNPGS